MAPTNSRIRTLSDIATSHYAQRTTTASNNDEAFHVDVDVDVAGAVGARQPHYTTPESTTTPYLYCPPVHTTSGSGSGSGSGTIHHAPPPPIISLAHIPNLAMADACAQTLQRVWTEFQPIIHRRGYQVKSVSELCCCGDGLDYSSLNSNSNAPPPPQGRRGRGRGRRPQKLRKQSDNVWGYNQTTFFGRRGKSGGGAGRTSSSTSHTIHLRLRQPKHHATQLLSWEDVAGTMAHELSHCVHQNHSKAFYQLMEELLEEHATLQVQAMGDGIYGTSSEQYGNSTVATPPVVVAATAALPTTGGGQRLGGKDLGNGKSRLLGQRNGGRTLGGPTQLLSPRSRRDAMAQAAERRQRQMQRLKRMIEKSKEPCVIEILEDDDTSDTEVVIDDDGAQDTQPRARSTDSQKDSIALVPVTTPTSSTRRNAKKAKRVTTALPKCETIDLTSPQPPPSAAAAAASSSTWGCPQCTFINSSLAVICEMCLTKKIAVDTTATIELLG